MPSQKKKLHPRMTVYSNLATSVDGKIATVSREFFGMGSEKDIHLLRKLRGDADAIIYGAEVLRAFQKACLSLKPKKRLVNAVLSRSLQDVDPQWPFFQDPRIDRILYVSEKIPAKRKKHFEKTCILVTVNGASVARDILGDLARRGYRHVGVEGGGMIMWEFARVNAIQKYYVTLTPRILGGFNAPTLVDGLGFTPEQSLNLKLDQVKKVGSELFLTYSPVAKRGVRHPEYR